jgi:hypothetical protein
MGVGMKEGEREGQERKRERHTYTLNHTHLLNRPSMSPSNPAFRPPVPPSITRPQHARGGPGPGLQGCGADYQDTGLHVSEQCRVEGVGAG